MSESTEVSGVIVLKAKTGLGTSAVKSYSIVRAEGATVDNALTDLPAGDYKVVDLGAIKDVNVDYETTITQHNTFSA